MNRSDNKLNKKNGNRIDALIGPVSHEDYHHHTSFHHTTKRLSTLNISTPGSELNNNNDNRAITPLNLPKPPLPPSSPDKHLELSHKELSQKAHDVTATPGHEHGQINIGSNLEALYNDKENIMLPSCSSVVISYNNRANGTGSIRRSQTIHNVGHSHNTGKSDGRVIHMYPNPEDNNSHYNYLKYLFIEMGGRGTAIWTGRLEGSGLLAYPHLLLISYTLLLNYKIDDLYLTEGEWRRMAHYLLVEVKSIPENVISYDIHDDDIDILEGDEDGEWDLDDDVEGSVLELHVCSDGSAILNRNLPVKEQCVKASGGVFISAFVTGTTTTSSSSNSYNYKTNIDTTVDVDIDNDGNNQFEDGITAEDTISSSSFTSNNLKSSSSVQVNALDLQLTDVEGSVESPFDAELAASVASITTARIVIDELLTMMEKKHPNAYLRKLKIVLLTDSKTLARALRNG